MAKKAGFRDWRFSSESEADRGRLSEILRNFGFLFLVVGLLLAIFTPERVEDLKFGQMKVGNLLRETETAFLIGGLIALTIEISSRKEQIRIFRRHLLESESIIERYMRTIAGGAKLMGFLEDLGRSDAPPIAREIARIILNEYVDGIEATGDGFTVRSTNWALESNHLFYKVLFDGNATNFEIRVTHAGPPEDWLDGNAIRSLEAQRKVVDSGRGKITRIFIGRDSKQDVDNDKKYNDVKKKMAEYSISTGYVQRNKTFVEDMTWIPDAGILMLWKRSEVGVDKVEIKNHDGDKNLKENLEELWTGLIQEAGLILKP